MALKIVCSGYLFRHPAGGHTWHHLQYLIGLQNLGHEVVFVEEHGWPKSCYDPSRHVMTSDPSYGIQYMTSVFERANMGTRWCFMAEDQSTYGMSREELADFCSESDLYLALSNMNTCEELALCRRRAMVDTDPAFTQIGAHGNGPPLSDYHILFTFGENVHQPGCHMPTADLSWLSTRQPVVVESWPSSIGDPAAPISTIMNWTAYGGRSHEGRFFGQKDLEFPPYFDLPSKTGADMKIAINGPDAIKARLAAGGWELADPSEISRDPWWYQDYISASRAEFCVAKHAYVSTRCGWFSDRSSAYLAMGRPVVLQDTGFSDFLPVGEGLLAFRTPDEAVRALSSLDTDYELHSRRARALIEDYFEATKVLTKLLEDCF